MKFAFADGEKIGLYENGKTEKYDSAYITRYRENTLKTAKNKEWKRNSELLVSEDYYFDTEDETEVHAAVRSVSLTTEENKILYSFTVNGTSGIYYKYTDDKEKTEAHIITSNEVEFQNVCVGKTGEILGAVQTDYFNADIAVFLKNGGDYKSLTGGDSLDENPSFDKDGNILFNSYAIGRDENNRFVTYLPSEIYRLNTANMEVETLVTDERYSYIKPTADAKGNLYCIKKEGVEKSDESTVLQILMIPVRIVQAIVGFISAFVMCFAKKPLVPGQSARSIGNGGDAAKNGGKDPGKAFVNNNLINVDKELKKNKKKEDYGFIPHSWKLVKLVPDADGSFENCKEYELAYGVADYALLEQTDEKNTLIYTNGKHIFEITDAGESGEKKKLLDVDFCLKVGGLQTFEGKDVFNA